MDRGSQLTGPASRRGPIELLHECERSRVTRLLRPGNAIICKEPLGPGREGRLRHERAILERLAGVPGVAQLAPTPALPGPIFLEDIRGTPLTGLVKPLEPADLVRLASEMARAVAAIHRRGVVHRDLSPANVLRADGTAVCLIDFALATIFGEIHLEFTHHNEIAGTLAYLAPEQTGRTARPVDHRADLYALGAMLYELATGAPPFGTGDPLRLSHDHLTRVPAPPVAVNPAVPATLSDIIERLLAKEPDNRYQSAEGLLHDLTSLGDGRPATGAYRIGARDFPLRPLSPSRLVGRREEVAALESAVARALRGPDRCVLVSGRPGVGKTSLINELRSIATAANGWFVAGKFDQFRQGHEFDAVWQAFGSLGRLLLAEPEEDLVAVRTRLRESLAADAGLLAAVQPDFATLLRVEPDRAVGDPLTLQLRLERTAVEVLRVVASPERPVVMAVDDLQWAGRTPLGFIDRVINDGNLPGVLLVGAYREGDAASAPPLAAMLSRWRQYPTGITHLRLRNLPAPGLAAFLAEMLRLGSGRAEELATLIAPHTRGNPYDTVELLESLRRDGLLELDGNGWRWDATALRHRLRRADVAELLAERTETLPPHPRSLLHVMACLGGRVDLSLLEAATGLSAAVVEERLLPALASGLLTMEPGPAQAARFRHDRVQEAILRRLGPRRQHATRLDLARRLGVQPELFAVAAEQYLPVVDAVTEPEERRGVAALLRRTADQARLLSNYALVDRCLATAAELDDDADAPQQIEMRTGRHWALYSLGRLEDADEVFGQLDRWCRTPTERAQATLVQISSLTNRSQPQQALDLGLELLRHLGCPIPARDRLADVVGRGLDEMYRWIDRTEVADDLTRAEITDARLLTIGSTINRMMAPAYLQDHTMHAWLVVQAWRIWQAYGPGRTLVGPVANIPLVAIRERPDHRTAQRVLRRIVAVGEARGYEPQTAESRLVQAFSGWAVGPLEDCARLARQARERLIRGGDLRYARISYDITIVQLLECGPSLSSCLAEVEAALTFARRTGNDYAADLFGVYRELIEVLQGTGQGRSPRGGGTQGRYDTNRPAAVGRQVARALAAALFDDSEELAAHTSDLLPLLPALEGTYPTTVAHVLCGLALAAQARTTPQVDGERDATFAELDRVIAWVAARSADSPVNFSHLLRLLEAERAWAAGDFRSTASAFDTAMREATTRQRPWHQALILEHAARFYLAHGLEHSGSALLADARQAYLAWGATAKVNQLDWAFPTLQAPSTAPREAADGESAETGDDRFRLTPGAVDLVSILAASRALSSETSIHGLRERVVEVLSTMTGATDVHLLLWNDNQGTWLLTVSGDSHRAPVPLDEAGRLGLVPISAVRYAERTREPLVVGDATRDDRFRRDPYLTGLDRCSLLAVPIRSRGAVQALLVLENRLISSAFTADRLDGVTLIAGQLAVSLHNTMLYTSLEHMVAERTEELAEANARLARLSVTDTLTGLANRRRLEEVLTGEWQRARRSHTPIAVAMVDIDHFKDYNDHYGHLAGDRCLQRVAALLHQHLRDVDLAARYGGEEFAIVMPGTDLHDALTAAERLRTAVVTLSEPHPLTAEQVVTVSIGVAAAVPLPHHHVDLLTQHADTQLYRAKRAGRNRVMPATTLVTAPGGR